MRACEVIKVLFLATGLLITQAEAPYQFDDVSLFIFFSHYEALYSMKSYCFMCEMASRKWSRRHICLIEDFSNRSFIALLIK